MVTTEALRQTTPERQIVAFDFDGTLTVRDSFMAFLKWRSGPLGWFAGLASLALPSMTYLGHRDRGRLKAAAVNVYLRGLTRDELRASAEAFARQAWSKLLRPDAERTWAEWKARGALMVIVTASPEEVVGPFAERLGADLLLGTRLAFDAEDRVQGTFEGLNCRAAEKVTRLQAQFGPDVRLAAAYGDTSGDTEMLAIAEIPGYRVFTGRPGAA